MALQAEREGGKGAFEGSSEEKVCCRERAGMGWEGGLGELKRSKAKPEY